MVVRVVMEEGRGVCCCWVGVVVEGRSRTLEMLTTPPAAALATWLEAMAASRMEECCVEAPRPGCVESLAGVVGRRSIGAQPSKREACSERLLLTNDCRCLTACAR